jgi:hypothetical protein
MVVSPKARGEVSWQSISTKVTDRAECQGKVLADKVVLVAALGLRIGQRTKLSPERTRQIRPR